MQIGNYQYSIHIHWVLKKWRWHMFAFGGYLVCILLILMPILPHFNSAIPGGPIATVDGWQNVWNLWWAQQALSNVLNPFYTHLLYYPEGVSLYLHTLNISNGILVLPITTFWGPIAGYNSAVIIAFVLAGIGGYGLAFHVSRRRLASFVSGLIFAFSPFHLTKLWDGQLELIALQWIAFYALFLLRAAEEPRRMYAVIAGCFLALIGYTSWYYLLFFAVYSVLFVFLRLVFHSTHMGRLGIVCQMTIIAVSGSLLLLPCILPELQLFISAIIPTEPFLPIPAATGMGFDAVLIARSANLLDFWLPSALHPLWGEKVTQLGKVWHPDIAAWNASLGYIPLIFAVVGGITLWRKAWCWWVLALTGMILALGPVLVIGNMQTSIPMPYAFLLSMPFIQLVNRPSHFIVITTLTFAPLVALGLGWALERIQPQWRRFFIGGVIALVGFEFVPSALPSLYSNVHPYYATIAGSKGVLMEIPSQLESSEPLQAQMTHRNPIVGGFLARTPDYPFSRKALGVQQLWTLKADEVDVFRLQPDDTLIALNMYGIRHILIHSDLLTDQQQHMLTTVLKQVLPNIKPVYSDAKLQAYYVPKVPPHPFGYLDTGWHSKEHDNDRHWRWMKSEGAIVIVNPTAHPVPVKLKLRAESYQELRRITFMLNNQKLGDWDIHPMETTLTFHFILPAGENTVRLQAPITQEYGTNRMLSIVLIEALFS